MAASTGDTARFETRTLRRPWVSFSPSSNSSLFLYHSPHKLPTLGDLFVAFIAFKSTRWPRRKALLIGVQTIREPSPSPEAETSPTISDTTPRGGYTPRGKLNKPKKPKKKIVASEIRPLKGPHMDVRGMRHLLIDVYHYRPEDITVLIDDDESDHVQPTRDNILLSIDNLVRNAREGDKFLFLFSGHAKQEDSDPGDHDEEDGKDEYILTSDGQHVMDNELRASLVDPLPVGSFLNAVFDCCHSGTLLDLFHFRCNRVYVPWLNKGRRRTRSLWQTIRRKLEKAQSFVTGMRELPSPSVTLNASIETHLESAVPNPEPDTYTPLSNTAPSTKTSPLKINTAVVRSESIRILSPTADQAQVTSPESLYCHGRCRDDMHFMSQVQPTAQVICLSSSKDCQLTWEDRDGDSMTQHLIRILRKEPNPMIHSLLTNISHAIHDFYLRLHEQARKYKKDVNLVNRAKADNGKQTVLPVEVEMHNFQDPQISTHHPLDMMCIFDP